MTAFGVPSGRFSSSDHSSAAQESGELTQGAKDDCTCARQLPQWAQAWARGISSLRVLFWKAGHAVLFGPTDTAGSHVLFSVDAASLYLHLRESLAPLSGLGRVSGTV